MKKSPILLPDRRILSARNLQRRDFLRGTALGLAAIPFLQACEEMSSTFADASNGAGNADAGFADASSNADAAAEADAAEADAGATVVGWAIGGTASMTAKASYPNPFTESLSACALVSTTTEGPCTTDTELAREDVSEGWSGLPVRLAIKVVDTSCNPLSGFDVKIWHTNIEGSYSGETPNQNMCLQNIAYASQDFFRGVQTTSSEGVVYFDTCFPGWYRGRAIHVHFQVKSGNTSTRVSQLFFPEDVTEDIFANHSEYEAAGQPDTLFSDDNIMSMIPAAERARHIMAIERMTDGVMLASKVVTVR